MPLPEKSFGTIDCIAFEAGTASFKIAKELIAEGHHVVVLNAADLAVIYASLKKTDKEDALKLARLIQRFGYEELPAVPVPTDEEMERRALSAHEMSFRSDRTRLVNRLHAVFLRNGIPELTKANLAKAKTREALIKGRLAGFSLIEALNLHAMVCQYETILEGLETQIRESVGECGEDADILLSIPGFGVKTVMGILAYAGDMARFGGPEQLVNYVGFAPRIYASGAIERRGGITKRGNAHLRGLLIQSAWGLVRTKTMNPLKVRYEQMLARGKPRFVAIVALARKMLELVYILLTRRERCWFCGEASHRLKMRKVGLVYVGVGS